MPIRFLIAALGLLALPAPLAAQMTTAPASAPTPTGPFTLDPLPWAADALAPVVDAETMTIHHGRHHRAYVDALNRAVAASPDLAGMSLEQLVARAGTLSPAIRNNGGGHWNHRFFWSIMTAPDSSDGPSAELAAAITRDFGSMDAMKAAFTAAGTSRFGSGWAWLIVTPDGRLAVTSTPNQDNPLMDVAEQRGTPILGNDVWEHAYYIGYRNRRADYLAAWWRVVDWRRVSAYFDTAMAELR